jgi:hypothetical protein
MQSANQLVVHMLRINDEQFILYTPPLALSTRK